MGQELHDKLGSGTELTMDECEEVRAATGKSMNDFLHIICENLSQLRLLHEISVEDMALIMHATQEQVRMIDRGEYPKRMSLKSVYCAINYFRISAEDVLKPDIVRTKCSLERWRKERSWIEVDGIRRRAFIFEDGSGIVGSEERTEKELAEE